MSVELFISILFFEKNLLSLRHYFEEMRVGRVISLIVALVMLCGVADAQTILLGERTPRFRQAKWLDGNEPKSCDFVCIEFVHSASLPCRQSVERLHQMVNSFDNMAFVMISHQSLTEIDSWVVKHIDKRSGVIFDDRAIRASFGVNYVPYAVIIDRKRRALWFGNPQLLDRAMIEKLIQK